MRGRVCIVTGANRSIGKETALGLARLGATVVMAARHPERLARACDEVRRASGNPAVTSVVVDLGNLASVRGAAREIATRHDSVHVLVNNAGVNLARRATTPDGFEMTFAVNHLGPFLLTRLLLDTLRAAAPSRVINVTSWFERLGRVDFEDPNAERKRYGALRAYYQSKLANALFTYDLARRLAGTGVTANCYDPGLVATDLLRDRFWWSPRRLQPVWQRFLLSPANAAAGLVLIASAPELATVTGRCFDVSGEPKQTSRRSHDRDAQERLWALSERLVGLHA